MGGASWYQAMNMGTPVIPTLKGHTSRVTAITWSPGASRIATCDRHGVTRVFHRDGTLERAFVSIRSRIPGVTSYTSWTPEGIDIMEGDAYIALLQGGPTHYEPIQLPGLCYEPPTS